MDWKLAEDSKIAALCQPWWLAFKKRGKSTGLTKAFLCVDSENERVDRAMLCIAMPKKDGTESSAAIALL